MLTVKQPKKLLIINILEILRKYSDEEHRLSQRDIEEILAKEYGMIVDRKAIKRNITDLIDFGYDIGYSEIVRQTPDKKTGEPIENVLLTDFYLMREFTDGELRLLIDSIVFSKHIPYEQCKELVEKLAGLSNKYFSSGIKHIARMSVDKTDNKQLFLNIELINEAISKKRKVSFKYAEYGTDKKEHARRRVDGTVREYKISPYQMAAKDGKYYLICNYDKFEDISNYRVDRIRELKILDEAAKPFETLKGANGQRLNLARYMQEHVYMYASEAERVIFRANKNLISDIIDLFGKDVKFSEEGEEFITVTAMTNEMSIIHFAKSFAPDVVILSPQKVADKVRMDLEKTLKLYM